MDFFLEKMSTFFYFWFYAENVSTPYSIKYQKIFLDTINYDNCMLFLNYAFQMPSIFWNIIFKVAAEVKKRSSGYHLGVFLKFFPFLTSIDLQTNLAQMSHLFSGSYSE
jgi:hypothetical protein